MLFCDTGITNDIVVILDNVLRHDVYGFASRLDDLSAFTTREYDQLAGRTRARRSRCREVARVHVYAECPR